MFDYTIKRILQGFLLIFIVSILTFLILKVIPADPATLILGTEASAENVEKLRESMGLNRPYYIQYIEWISNAIRGDLGKSYYFGKSVNSLIHERLPSTFLLASTSIIITFFVSILLGTLASLKRGKTFDHIIRLLTQISTAMPSFWLGMIALTYLAARLKIFPITPSIDFSNKLSKNIYNIILPAVVLSLGQMGPLIRQVRSSMIYVLDSDYILSARIRGLSSKKIIFKYALKSAIIAPITLTGLQFANLFGGTAVIETVFSLAGIGRLLVVSVEQRDIILLQGIVLFITSMVVIISIITDIISSSLNKSIKMEISKWNQ